MANGLILLLGNGQSSVAQYTYPILTVRNQKTFAKC